MPGELPIIDTGRSLVPGTTMTLPVERAVLAGIDRVVVVHRRASGELSGVGTVARVEGSLESSVHGGYVTVTGLHLADVDVVDDRARVASIDEGRADDAGPLLEFVTARLRRYMAVRSEAGEGGDIHITVSPDPVMASNQVASLLEVSWPEVQEVLEAGDAVARLERGAEVLERETALLEAVIRKSGE